MKFKINMPKEVSNIIDSIESSGHEAYVVGGCVRDSLIGRTPGDWDITTSALPEEIKRIVKGKYKVIETGLKHGTVTLVSKFGEQYEVTTFRIDGEYLNNRSPEKVEFTKSLKEDLKRRDFTINAMAYNPRVGLQDYFNGALDLEKGIIKAVNVAEERFNEDALRILRGVRFSCQLGFEIYKETEKAMRVTKDGLSKISKERIRDEFSKILISDNPSYGIRKLVCNNLMEYIVPEIMDMVGFDQCTPYHDKDIFEHTMSVVEHVRPTVDLRLSALLHDIGKPICFTKDENNRGHFYKHENVGYYMSKDIMKRLKFDNKTIKKVSILVLEHMNRDEKMSLKAIKKLIGRIGEDNIKELFELQIADIVSSAEKYRDYSYILRAERKADTILNEKQPIFIKDLKVTGKDVMDLGVREGKDIGQILSKLLELVLEVPEYNEKSRLIEYIRKEILV